MLFAAAVASILAFAPTSGWAAALAQDFVAPAPCPTCSSPNYIGKNNGTLPRTRHVQGKAFKRFIQIWLENTDYNVAASSPAFRTLAKQGITLPSYLALTHPSQPNYIAAVSGDFYGLDSDDYFHIPSNITTIVDLLENKHVSWATYQENMPRLAYPTDYTQTSYVDPDAGDYVYYRRKHSPLVIHDDVVNVTSRAQRIRNFNDFAADVNADRLPQWMFVTPNMVNDAHDTTIDYTSSWLEYWLLPLLKDPKFNSGEGCEGTLILLTFDENSSYNVRNNVFTLLLGSAVPKHLHGTNDTTLYSHWSSLSSVEANWGLDNLGRGDTNATMANIFQFVAKEVGYHNTHTPVWKEPQTNITGAVPGPLNPEMWLPFPAPQRNVSRFGGKTFTKPGLDWSITYESFGTPLNLTYDEAPDSGIGNIVYTGPQ